MLFPLNRALSASLLGLIFPVLLLAASVSPPRPGANRLTYLDESDPFYVNLKFPKLITPQWVGEPGVEAVVILSIDDMTDPPKYENFLRPILERLKQIDGRAPVSIMTVSIDPQHSQLQAWLKEGLSLEVHTLSHPCPLLAKGNFHAAANTYHGCVDLLNHVPGNKPVAFRMPCCDSMNSASPRFYAELFNETNSAGQYLAIDSSVMNITTTNDTSLPRELVLDAGGREKFRKYIPFPSFATTIEDYPYPYVIGNLCWEFPGVVPSDWEAQHLHGVTNPITVGDWKAALDAAVIKQGVFNLIFHPHGWIRSDQIVELIDYAVATHGKKIKFLTFREAQERLNKNLLAGQSLRAADGRDNGVRLLDLNNDGYMDAIVANHEVRQTRVWQPKQNRWLEMDFPTALVDQHYRDTRLGIVRADGGATVLQRFWNGDYMHVQAWDFDGQQWNQNTNLLSGVRTVGGSILSREDQMDRGVRLRDADNCGRCELIVSNSKENAIAKWSDEKNAWEKLPFALPEGVSIVDEQGRDNGFRFVDVNEDGFADILFSNPAKYSLHLFVTNESLGFERGWTMNVRGGKRGDPGEIPMIVRSGEHPNNGTWIHSHHLWVQNEDTASKPDLVERRSFDELLALDAPPAKSPEESLSAIKTRSGFKVELVAAEPLIKDPVAFEWGADRKLWVVEMGDYPLGIDGKRKSGGVVRFLEDTDGDGRHDRSTAFLEGLNFPNGIFPWRNGVIISAAPEIIYAEDTDGDGKADVRRVLFSGFVEGNQQHRANGFDYGLDNWLYGANGDSGGEITSATTGKKVNISGRDFRFRLDTGEFESECGQTQFGRHHDDWGNWFGNNNSVWLWHYLFQEHYLTRNPHLPVKETKNETAHYLDVTRVYPVSRALERFNWAGGVNHLTSGNSATPYRDELFGPEFATSVFISEPVHNLVHQEVLEADGITFKSHRAKDEEQSEFLASADNWFRPTMLKTGPDGALYIADMYRLVIEHPEWIPAERQKRIDLRAGSDQGRIYRVYPADATLRKIPRLDQLSTGELVAALDSPNGWQRDTVQRLLVHAQDKSAIKPLKNLIVNSANPKVRMQALCVLDGVSGLTPDVLNRALSDSNPQVREQAIRLSEGTVAAAFRLRGDGVRNLKAAATAEKELFAAILRLADDPEIRVRYQLVFTLGEWQDERAAQALAKLAMKDWENPQMQIAIISSASKHVGEMLTAILAETNPPPNLVEQLLGLATALNDEKVFVKVLGEVSTAKRDKVEVWQFSALAGFLDALDRRGQTLVQFRERAGADLKTIIDRLDRLFVQARRRTDGRSVVGDPQPELLAAIRLLGRGLTQHDEDVTRLSELLLARMPGEIQKAALAGLKRIKGDRTAEVLASAWNSLGPALRPEALNVFASRGEWTGALLGAIERGRIPAGQIPTAQQQKLLAHADQSIRERAQKLFSATNPDRDQVFKEYQTVAQLTGDTAKGSLLFQQNCVTCHRLKGQGTELGPDLGALADKPVEVLLTAILNPNQAVEARYANYTGSIKSGRDFSGIIVAETANSITLRAPGGSEETILRADLKALSGSGLSLMPEGFEKVLKPQDMADLLAYLKSR